MSFDILVVSGEIGRIARPGKYVCVCVRVSGCVSVRVSGCVSVRVSVCVRMSEREDEKIKKKVKCLENFFSCQSSCLNYMTRTKRGNNWLERKKQTVASFQDVGGVRPKPRP